MSHIVLPDHSSAAIPLRLPPINFIRELLTRFGSSTSRALNSMMSTIVSDRPPPTIVLASARANLPTNNPSPSFIHLVALPPPVYHYHGDFHNFSTTSFASALPPYPGTRGTPPRYAIDLEEGVPIRYDNRGRQRYPITSVFLGGRSTVIPQTTGRSAWPLPDSYKKLFLFIVCVIAFSGCIALAMLIPKMHNRPCHPCEIPAHTA